MPASPPHADREVEERSVDYEPRKRASVGARRGKDRLMHHVSLDVTLACCWSGERRDLGSGLVWGNLDGWSMPTTCCEGRTYLSRGLLAMLLQPGHNPEQKTLLLRETDVPSRRNFSESSLSPHYSSTNLFSICSGKQGGGFEASPAQAWRGPRLRQAQGCPGHALLWSSSPHNMPLTR